MGGMASVFKKLIPFVMIICLIAFGISTIFGSNLTYLTTAKVNGITFYKYDFSKYVKNLNWDYIKSSITNVIDVKSLQQTFQNFTDIWKTGYKFGNIMKTISAVIVMLINIVLTFLNILLVPLRIIGGLLLTALNLLGINTKDANTPVIKLLKIMVNLYRTNNKGEITPFIPLLNYKAGESGISLVTTVPSL